MNPSEIVMKGSKARAIEGVFLVTVDVRYPLKLGKLVKKLMEAIVNIRKPGQGDPREGSSVSCVKREIVDCKLQPRGAFDGFPREHCQLQGGLRLRLT